MLQLGCKKILTVIWLICQSKLMKCGLILGAIVGANLSIQTLENIIYISLFIEYAFYTFYPIKCSINLVRSGNFFRDFVYSSYLE